jgi:hypothetical protein
MSLPSDYKIENVGSQDARELLNNLFEYLLTNGSGRTDIAGGSYNSLGLSSVMPNTFIYVPNATNFAALDFDHTMYVTTENSVYHVPLFTLDQVNRRAEYIIGDYIIKQIGSDLDFVNSSGSTVMRLSASGDLSISGTLTQNSAL